MKITFIYHSCYVVEFENIVFIFDYFKGNLPTWNQDKKICFFVSHKHQDHFSFDIFSFIKQYKNVTYVLSNDIKLSDKFLLRHDILPDIKKHITFIGKEKDITINIEDERLKIETLRSTDQGVAFLITYEGRTIYHAGDLNWWSWRGETEEEYAEMSQNYINEINKLTDRKIDCAFVVLDPRQEERYWWGMDYFLKATSVPIVFPMHCWEKYWIMGQFKKDRAAQGYCNRVKEVKFEGETFVFE